MKLNIIEFPSNMFLCSGKELVAEASDLGNRHLQPLYDDACDVGFAVKSELTGAVVVYVMEKVLYHGDGEDREVSGWTYTPSSESVRNVPSCIGTTATILND